MKNHTWLIFTLTTMIFWGIWGALIEIPEKAGFPATLGFVVWALTMIPPALVAMKIVGWKVETDRMSVFQGMAVGLLGAGGQLILFQTLRLGPAYIVFPIISLSPVVTILMSFIILREKTDLRGWGGIIIALLAIPFLSYQPPENSQWGGYTWVILALFVFFAWGIQGFIIKSANLRMSAESIFFYMTISALILIPFAIKMTDFSAVINWRMNGPWLAALIQVLNAIGALCLVYAFRYGKAIIVSPLTNAGAPMITIVLSLLIHQVIPNTITTVGIILAVLAAVILAIEPDDAIEASFEKQEKSSVL